MMINFRKATFALYVQKRVTVDEMQIETNSKFTSLRM